MTWLSVDSHEKDVKAGDATNHELAGRILLVHHAHGGPIPDSRVSATHPNPAWRPKPSSLWPPVPPTLHLTLNLGFALGIVSFFVSRSVAGLVAGAVFFGISNAGADVAWGLWVTKFAPPERVADYMSVHTCFTGVRGVVAPVVAFQLVSGVPLNVLGWISVGLIVIGSAFLVPEIKFGKTARRGAALMENISE